MVSDVDNLKRAGDERHRREYITTKFNRSFTSRAYCALQCESSWRFNTCLTKSYERGEAVARFAVCWVLERYLQSTLR